MLWGIQYTIIIRVARVIVRLVPARGAFGARVTVGAAGHRVGTARQTARIARAARVRVRLAPAARAASAGLAGDAQIAVGVGSLLVVARAPGRVPQPGRRPHTGPHQVR